jgi:hypothetical protein
MENNDPNMLITFLPLILMSLLMAIPAHLLAKEKGRNVALWTVLALVPIVNFACFWYFIGASNLKLERKIDDLIHQMNITSKRSE